MNLIPLKTSAKFYKVNEIFYSLQGEGIRAGEPSLFLRFSDCNLRCTQDKMGFDCDTEFVSGRHLGLEEILENLKKESSKCRWVILTGGEPSLQADESLLLALRAEGYKIAIETNGTKALPDLFDWISVSPKTAEHTLRQRIAHEVKYVRAYGMGIPQTQVKAEHYLISPAFRSDGLDRETLEWCIQLCRDNPPWRLSLQQHKLWSIR